MIEKSAMPILRHSTNRMNISEGKRYHNLLNNLQAILYFEDEITRFHHAPSYIDDLIRRYSLNGDGQLDMKEFTLAMIRLEIIGAEKNGSNSSRAIDRAREIFLLFCLSDKRKLEIDLFCQIMREWYSKLVQIQQHNSFNTIVKPFSPKDSCKSPVFTPYAVEFPESLTDGLLENSDNTEVCKMGSNAKTVTLWKRLKSMMIQHLDKLSQLFFKMDLNCSGSIGQDEFELVLTHAGISLTPSEYDEILRSISSKYKDHSAKLTRCNDGSTADFCIRYAALLSDIMAAQSTRSNQVPPPVDTPLVCRSIADTTHTRTTPKGTTRLWDAIIMSADKLGPMLKRYERDIEPFLTSATLRDCLLRCGLNISDADFTGLRVRLLSITDTNGRISIQQLLHTLKKYDKVMDTSPLSPSGVKINCFRTGRKTKFNKDDYYIGETIPAGKSNKERNAAASRTLVKIHEENRCKDDVQGAIAAYQKTGKNDFYDRDRYILERQILARMKQIEGSGLVGDCSVQALFPGDRFGRISIGQFRQNLVQMNLHARNAEVKSLSDILDPYGCGYMFASDFYDHMSRVKSLDFSGEKDPSSPCGSTRRSNGRFLNRAAQKILETIVQNFGTVVELCHKYDAIKSNDKRGKVDRKRLLRIIYDLGVLSSPSDMNDVVSAVLSQNANTGEVHDEIDLNGFENRLSSLTSDLLSLSDRINQNLNMSSNHGIPGGKCKEAWPSTTKACSNVGVTGSGNNWGNEYGSGVTQNRTSRRMNHAHPAAGSTIQIIDRMHANNEQDKKNEVGSSPRIDTDHRQRSSLLGMISILQDILEQRHNLRTAMHNHRNADSHGNVPVQDLSDILLSSRMCLNFSSSSTSDTSVKHVLQLLFPEVDANVRERTMSGATIERIGFLELLSRISKIYNDMTKYADAKKLMQKSDAGNNQLPYANDHVKFSDQDDKTVCLSIFQKLRSKNSQLRDLLFTHTKKFGHDVGIEQKQSGAILMRHVFKYVSSTAEGATPIANGEYETFCRIAVLRNICHQLGLDLNVRELETIMKNVDPTQTGFVSSSQLLDYFVRLVGEVDSSHFYSDKSDGMSDRLDLTSRAHDVSRRRIHENKTTILSSPTTWTESKVRQI